LLPLKGVTPNLPIFYGLSIVFRIIRPAVLLDEKIAPRRDKIMWNSLSMAIFEKNGKSPSILVHESSRM